jgi:hypothetical protein
MSNYTLLTKECNVIIVLEASFSNVSMCSLNILSLIASKYFTVFTKRNIPSIQRKKWLCCWIAKRRGVHWKISYDRWPDGQSVLLSGQHLGPLINPSFLLKFSLNIWWFAIMGCPLWGEDRSVICSWRWALSAQSFSGACSAGLINRYSYVKFQLPSVYGSRFPYSFSSKASHKVLGCTPTYWVSVMNLHAISIVMYMQRMCFVLFSPKR